MSLTIDIADAVVAELVAGSFSQAFVPERRVLPEFDIADMHDLKVTVVPKAVEISGSSRSVCQYEVQVDIGIQKKLGTNLDVQVAELLDLVDEIADYLRRRVLQNTPWAVWLRTANDPIYAPDHIAQQRVFTSVLTLTYRAMK